ncbi:MAG TPA: sigma-54 dependent transcriptional regulator [Kofleriaceae bacterium]|nr:sigma-54 dependent transcriptional regulator [Kofleriaceae bacterium]
MVRSILRFMGGLRILVIAGDRAAAEALASPIASRGHTAALVASEAELTAALAREGADLVVIALPLAGARAAGIAEVVRTHDPRIALVVTGRDDEVSSAGDAAQLGAREYLADPLSDPGALSYAIGLVVGARRSDAQLGYLRQRDAARVERLALLGHSPAMRKVLQVIRQVCQRTAGGGTPTILITGETGTGKGLLAKSIHYGSRRRGRGFVEVNCAAIPPTLLEAELFGYERGAFTDARTARPGLFETADAGTLFLDEIGSLPLDTQAKLLTAIEEKTLRRLGARQSIRVDVQIIAATHRDLSAMVRLGEFRHDLYHRLHVVTVELPPLRERGADRLLLAHEFIATMCREYGMPERRLSDGAMRAIERYSWPGNVRELRNQIERVILLEDDEVIRAEHFHFATEPDRSDRSDTGDEVEVAEAGDGDGVRVRLPDSGVAFDELERAVLRQALERCQGNVSSAARFLSITRQTLMYRMKKHGLSDDS